MTAFPHPYPAASVTGAPAPDSPQELLPAGEQFLRLPEVDAGPERITQVRAEIARTGTYRHTSDELAIGCRIAWRNHAGCADRMGWTKLQVVDQRHLHDARAIADACRTHLAESVNSGRIRPRITVFAPDTPQRPGPVIWNDQLVRYAGYPADADHDQVLGDPISAELTRAALALGWPGGRLVDDTDGLGRTERGVYDPLPLVIQTHHEGPQLFELTHAAVREVVVGHPTNPDVERLGMIWYAAPVISNMKLVIGGITYPAAPFGGWYQAWEVAQDLGAAWRYSLLPALADTLDLDPADPLRVDRALLELITSVLHSYRSAGVMIGDHHRAAHRHHLFAQQLAAADHAVSALPQVAVPPVSTCVMPTWPDTHVDHRLLPNFVRHATVPYASGAARRGRVIA